MEINANDLNKLFNIIMEHIDPEYEKMLDDVLENDLPMDPYKVSSIIGNEISKYAKLLGFTIGPDGIEPSPLKTLLFSLFMDTYPTFDTQIIEEELQPSGFIVGTPQNPLNPVGGSRKGTLSNVPYDEIVNVFGNPSWFSDDEGSKVQAEWDIRFDNGVRASIYDYKSLMPLNSILNWSIGGNSPHSAYEVYKIMGNFND